MNKYVTSPIEIEAIQITEDVFWEYICEKKLVFDKFTFNGQWNLGLKSVSQAYVSLAVNTKCNFGDWIIKDSDGNFSVLSDSAFQVKYNSLSTQNITIRKTGYLMMIDGEYECFVIADSISDAMDVAATIGTDYKMQHHKSFPIAYRNHPVQRGKEI